jgi:DNA-binding transcriptional LysR family regulator
MKIDERHLAFLSAVVDCGGASEAASLLGTSQPALSRMITTLERRLGEPLFVKGRRPLRPTPLGATLASYGRAILDASRKAAEAAHNHKGGGAGLVRLGGVPYIMDGFVSRMIASFQLKDPDIRIEQSYGYVDELLNRLEADQIDLALAPVGFVDPSSALHSTPIIPVNNVIACSSSHPLLLKKRIVGPDLLEYPWAAPLLGSPLALDIQRIQLSLGIGALPVRYAGGSLMAVLNYIAHGNALALLPHMLVRTRGAELRVASLAFDIPQSGLTLCIVARSAQRMLPTVARLTAHIKSQFLEVYPALAWTTSMPRVRFGNAALDLKR